MKLLSLVVVVLGFASRCLGQDDEPVRPGNELTAEMREKLRAEIAELKAKEGKSTEKRRRVVLPPRGVNPESQSTEKRRRVLLAPSGELPERRNALPKKNEDGMWEFHYINAPLADILPFLQALYDHQVIVHPLTKCHYPMRVFHYRIRSWTIEAACVSGCLW